jgi:hypothetical protein
MNDGWWRSGHATEICSLLTVKGSGSMKMKNTLIAGVATSFIEAFEQTVFSLVMSKRGSFSSVFLRVALGLYSFCGGRQVRPIGAIWTTKCSLRDVFTLRGIYWST